MIVETSKGKFEVVSHAGKSLSKKNLSKKEAAARLAEVEMFKHMKKGSVFIDLNKAKGKTALVPKKMLVERNGKQYMTTVYISPGFGSNKRERAELFEDNEEQASMRKELKERGIPVSMAYKITRMAGSKDAPLQAVVENKKGQSKYLYSQEHKDKQAAEKFARIAELHKARPKIAEQLNKDFDKSDEAKVLYLMQKTGIRVGGKTESGSVGASSLEGKHIRVEGDNVTFTFPQKGGKPMQTSIQDKKLAKALKDKTGKIFNTTDEKCRQYLKDIYPDKEFRTHDLRDYYATSMAAALVKQTGDIKSKKEYDQMVKEVGERVSEKLGNTPAMALKEYIHPAVFRKQDWFDKALYIDISKARIGLTPTKMMVTRGGKTFEMTVYVHEGQKEPQSKKFKWEDVKGGQQARDQFYKSFGLNVYADKKCTEKMINGHGRALEDMFNRFPGLHNVTKDAVRAIEFFKSRAVPSHISNSANAKGTYNPSTNSISIASVSHASDKVTIGSYLTDSSASGVLRHELGHAVHKRLFFIKKEEGSKQWNFMNDFTKDQIKKGISTYASTNLSEAFAESFAAYTSPKYKEAKKKLPKEVEQYFDQLFLSMEKHHA